MEVDWPLPSDPFSDAYRCAVLEMYDWLRGGPYSLANELTPFDHSAAVVRPFPFFTGSPVTAGNHLAAIGHLIRTAGAGESSQILELGAGWGNVALFLAQLGCQVTVLDISEEFVKLIDDRAACLGVQIETRIGDFHSVSDLDGTYDVVLFFESFHHCLEHGRLVQELDRIVRPGGRIVFAAEPVARRFWCPWGLRLDGESVWAIRRNGWPRTGLPSVLLPRDAQPSRLACKPFRDAQDACRAGLGRHAILTCSMEAAGPVLRPRPGKARS